MPGAACPLQSTLPMLRFKDQPPREGSVMPSIYRDGNPAELPLYALSEAAHYLRLPARTWRAWAVGRRYDASDESSFAPPLIAAADQDTPLLSFHNLVELHVLSSI